MDFNGAALIQAIIKKYKAVRGTPIDHPNRLYYGLRIEGKGTLLSPIFSSSRKRIGAVTYTFVKPDSIAYLVAFDWLNRPIYSDDHVSFVVQGDPSSKVYNSRIARVLLPKSTPKYPQYGYTVTADTVTLPIERVTVLSVFSVPKPSKKDRNKKSNKKQNQEETVSLISTTDTDIDKAISDILRSLPTN